VIPISDGELRKNGGVAFPSPSERTEPGIGVSRPSSLRKPLIVPSPPAFKT
jgi:hypothetical protein